MSAQTIEQHLKKYPEMKYRDALKLAVQSVFGSAHFSGSEEDAALSIEREIAAIDEDPRSFPIADAGDHLRLELKNPLVRSLGSKLLGKLFFLSSADDKALGVTPEKLAIFREYIEAADRIFAPDEDAKPESQKLLEAYESGIFESVCHSAEYRAAYLPSYRVISKKFGVILAIVFKIHSLLESADGRRVTVALEGRCASGKTTAAAILSELFDAPVIPMDDFFLPKDRKTADRLAEPGGNVDYERFALEIIPNLRTKDSFTYNAFDCSKGRLFQKSVPSGDLIIVEGVYSMRTEFRLHFDLTVFLRVSKETQKERLMSRNPALYPMFEEHWIPLEEHYFKVQNPEEFCDLKLRFE